ncbi:unnamed protein product [Closterium sp. Yama58-4]|nr:unnamed protein product [Closterium sp. Yama58-4]
MKRLFRRAVTSPRRPFRAPSRIPVPFNSHFLLLLLLLSLNLTPSWSLASRSSSAESGDGLGAPRLDAARRKISFSAKSGIALGAARLDATRIKIPSAESREEVSADLPAEGGASGEDAFESTQKERIVFVDRQRTSRDLPSLQLSRNENDSGNRGKEGGSITTNDDPWVQQEPAFLPNQEQQKFQQLTRQEETERMQLQMPSQQHRKGLAHVPRQQHRRRLSSYDMMHERHMYKRRRLIRGKKECWSKHERHQYWQAGAHVEPSAAFTRQKTEYERMHQRCTEGITDWKAFYFNQSEGLSPAADVEGCKYAFLIPGQWHGLGNRIMSLISTFTYAFITHRAILMPDDGLMPSLLCNPFEHSSWLIPASHFWSIKADLEQGPRNVAEQADRHSRGVFCHLDWITPEEEWTFFCRRTQEEMAEKPFMMFWSDMYFVPPLYFVPSLAARLEVLFPDRRVFTHVARYILLPANYLWDRIVRAFHGHMEHQDVLVGLQVRPVEETPEDVFDRVLTCLISTQYLPAVIPPDQWQAMADDVDDEGLREARGQSIGVFVASLNGTYGSRLAALYSQGKPQSAQTVTFHSESHDAAERQDDRQQYASALIEMFLLSFSHRLVVSDYSTFGYTAAALGSLDPWSLNIVKRGQADWRTNNRPVCQRTESQPCSLSIRPKFTCPDGDLHTTESEVSFVRPCPVIGTGLHLELPPLPETA